MTDYKAIAERVADSYLTTLLYDHPEFKHLPADAVAVIFQAGMLAGMAALGDVLGVKS